jgi:hypothetical protein
MGNTDPDYLPLLKSLMRTAYRCDSTKVFFEAFSFCGHARFHATCTLGNSTSSRQRLLPALAEKDREFKEAVKKDEMHLIARECFWDEEIPGAMVSRDAKWKNFIETTREYTEKLLDMLEASWKRIQCCCTIFMQMRTDGLMPTVLRSRIQKTKGFCLSKMLFAV